MGQHNLNLIKTDPRLAFIEDAKNTNMNFKFFIISLIITSGFVGTASAQLGGEDFSQEEIEEMKSTAVVIETNQGKISIQLFPEDAPNHVHQFLSSCYPSLVMDVEEEIQAHILSVWKEKRGFFSGKGSEGMLILTDRRLLFIKKTEAPMRWWGAIRTRQIVRLLQNKDVMFTEDGYDATQLEIDLENKKNQKISFNNILQLEVKEKVWGSVLFLDVMEDGKEQKYQFSIVQDWVKYPLSAPTKFLKVDWSGFVKYIKDKQIVTN